MIGGYSPENTTLNDSIIVWLMNAYRFSSSVMAPDESSRFSEVDLGAMGIIANAAENKSFKSGHLGGRDYFKIINHSRLSISSLRA